MQFPADVQELRMPPLATVHRQATNRTVPGDTVENDTEKGKDLNINQKVIFL